MKTRLFLILFIFSCFSIQAFENRIDLIKTDQEATTFITDVFKKNQVWSKYYKFSFEKPDSIFRLWSCDSSMDSWEIQRWKKTDFNADGRTDLFVVGYQQDTVNSKTPQYAIYAIIDKGNNSFDLHQIPGFHLLNCYAAKLVTINNKPFVVYRHYKTETIFDNVPTDSLPTLENVEYKQVGQTDTLVYKFGGFIEYNPRPSAVGIKSLFFETSPCMGACPVFKMNVFYEGLSFYQEEAGFGGKFENRRTVVKTEQLQEISRLVQYLDLSTLNSRYSVDATCQASSNLIVFFSDGSVETVSDYGLQGTLGLVRLYEMIFDLRSNQAWK